MINQANHIKSPVSALIAYAKKQHEDEILCNLVPKKLKKYHEERLIHIHDLEYFDLTYNCIGVSIENMVHETMNFRQMLRALSREIVELTNLQSGGIGFIDFDKDAASYLETESDDEILESLHELFLDINTNSRKGSEKPYVTFNFGLDTTLMGRRISRLMLKAYMRGDANGHPLVFPNMVFKIKSGINYESDTINYDLYQEALTVTSMRMVPTYFNCDSSSNCGFDATSIGIMGCRTRVASNINGKTGALNRGNIASTTINLVQVAHRANGSLKKFYNLLEAILIEVKNGLIYRLKTLCSKADFTVLFGKGYYCQHGNADTYSKFSNGTLAIGFIGLWDAIETLHHTSFSSFEELLFYREEAYHIISYMRQFTDKATTETHLNFSLLASAAEGVTGRFAEHDKDFINAAQKGFYTNSFHTPVDMHIDCFQKCELEAPFHALCNGGAITYVEFEEMPSGNVEAVNEIISYAHDMDCNYIGINFRMDNCCSCGYVGRISNNCPKCNSHDVRRLRRVSGYLSEDVHFTVGKQCELKKRTSNMHKNAGSNR